MRKRRLKNLTNIEVNSIVKVLEKEEREKKEFIKQSLPCIT